MTDSIGVRPWMCAPPTVAVLDALEAAGGEGCARFVGGGVRNALLDQPVDDIDIATTLTPPAVSAALKAAGLKAVPTGVEHGTVTAVAQGRPFEITTLRRDVETDGRRAVVAFTEDWAEDARRRDFTLNSLYADREGRVLDITGRGVADARAGRIVFVGDAQTRIREDHLRILRFFRFQAWYGRGAPDATALAACVAHRALLGSLAAERVSKELLKLLAAEDPTPVVELMARTGVLGELIPQASDLARLASLVREGPPPDPLLRLAALLPDDPATGAATAERLRLSNQQRERLGAALAADVALRSDTSLREARRILYRVGAQAFVDRVRLVRATAGGDADAWRELVALAEGWRRPVLPVNGDDAIRAGATRGPMVGSALREVEAWWIDADFPPERERAAEKLQAVVREMAR